MTAAFQPLPLIESPCIGVCTLDDAGRCIGCHRSNEEIARWTTFTAEQRRCIMAELPVRAERARNCG